MILDVTGVELVPGNFGQECPGNGEHMDIECCCEECDYMLCCTDDRWVERVRNVGMRNVRDMEVGNGL